MVKIGSSPFIFYEPVSFDFAFRLFAADIIRVRSNHRDPAKVSPADPGLTPPPAASDK